MGVHGGGHVATAGDVDVHGGAGRQLIDVLVGDDLFVAAEGPDELCVGLRCEAHHLDPSRPAKRKAAPMAVFADADEITAVLAP